MNEKDYANWSKEELIKEITKFKKIKSMVWFGKINQNKWQNYAKRNCQYLQKIKVKRLKQREAVNPRSLERGS